MNKTQITSISFSKKFILPTEEKDRSRGFMKWGKKNDYPFYLIELLQGSAWHQGIIKNKTFYIAGGGIETVSGDLNNFLKNPFSDFTIEEIAQRMAFDYEVFGAYCVKGTWNQDGSAVAKWEHIDVDAARLSEDEMMLFLSDDWSSMQQTPEGTNFRSLSAYDDKNRQGTFFIYYKEPSKQAKGEKGVYAKPPYFGGITAIQTDCDISKFHMYEIQNGFKAGTLINFPGGQPESVEEENAIKQQVKGKSQSIEETGEIVITFSNSPGEAPTVLSLNGNDLAERYLMTEKSVQQNILVSHSITAPTLFGVIQEGSFNAAESADLFEIFKMTYVHARQKALEWGLNFMAKLSGAVGTLKLADVQPIKSAVQDAIQPSQGANPAAAPAIAPDATVDVAKSALNGAQIASLVEVVSNIKSGILTPDSALQIVLASFPSIDEAQARKIVGLPSMQMNSCSKGEFSADEVSIFSEYGADKSEYKVLKSTPIAWNTEHDEVIRMESMMQFDKVGDITATLNDVDKNVLEMLKNGEDTSTIAKATKQTVQKVTESIDKLTKLEVITKGELTSLGEALLENVKAPVSQFEVRYSYEKRPDVSGPSKLPDGRTRDFCERLIDLNRFYTRQEIEAISARVDRNVWLYKGGWYSDPKTGVTTPYCRHEWNQSLVIKR